MRCASRRRPPRLPVKVLIPGSRLAAVAGHLYTPDPVVSDGDNVYEVNLSDSCPTADQRARRDGDGFAVEPEAWMLLDTERAFLRCIAGDDADDVEDLIMYARKNHWFGGKNILINLDSGKTILNKQTKLVLHNSNPQNISSYHVSNTSNPSKKTDFTLEEWPYVSQNQFLITKGNEYKLPPWMRSRNKRFNSNFFKSKETSKLACHVHQQQQHPEQSNCFYPPSPPPSLQQVFVYGQSTMIPVAYQPPNSFRHPQRWFTNFYKQLPRLSAPLLPRYHCRNSPVDIADNLRETVIKHNKIKNENTVLLESSTRFDDTRLSTDSTKKHTIDLLVSREDIAIDKTKHFVSDKCVEKIISTFETNNKDALRRFLCLLKRVYPKRLKEFDKIMITMDYLNSQPSIIM